MKGNGGKDQGIPYPKKIKEILDYISEKMPELFRKLSGLLYTPKASKQFGVVAATFFKQLKDEGVTEERAFEFTSQHISKLDFEGMIREFGSSRDNDCFTV